MEEFGGKIRVMTKIPTKMPTYQMTRRIKARQDCHNHSTPAPVSQTIHLRQVFQRLEVVATRRIARKLAASWTGSAKEVTRKMTIQNCTALSAKATVETKLKRETVKNT